MLKCAHRIEIIFEYDLANYTKIKLNGQREFIIVLSIPLKVTRKLVYFSGRISESLNSKKNV